MNRPQESVDLEVHARSGASEASGAPETPEPEVVLERRGGRVDILLNRPRRLNAFTAGMFARLTQICAELADDRGTRVVVVRGAGTAFAAGNDIAMFAGRTGEQIMADYETTVMGMLDALYGLPQLTVAAIDGVCVGGGLAVATCCDVRIATTGARFGYPIVRTLGNALSTPVLARCVAVFGESATRAMLLTGRTIDAGRAHDLGAVLEVARDADELGALVDELAAGALRTAPVTIETTKRQLAHLAAAATDPAYDARERELLRAVYDSGGFREGVRAFLAKEKPTFPPDRLAARADTPPGPTPAAPREA